MAITGEMAEALMKNMMQGQFRKRTPKARKRKSGFEAKFVLFPIRWVERLREAGVGGTAYHLALAILIENFKVEQFVAKEIILSERITGLSRRDRQRAIANLVRLKLIAVRRGKGRAVRVVNVYL
jgi:hypothetical protein